MTRDVSFVAGITWLIKSNALLSSNNTTLTVDPFLSVCFAHERSILISACVVYDLGIVPYWFSAIFSTTAGLTCSFTMNSSAIFDRTGVKEIGRRCLLTSFTGFSLGTGTTSADFQDGGRQDSLKEQPRLSLTGSVKKSEFSLNSHAGIPWGPETFVELREVVSTCVGRDHKLRGWGHWGPSRTCWKSLGREGKNSHWLQKQSIFDFIG